MDLQKPMAHKRNGTVFFLFLLITLANYGVQIGFSLKPYMIFSLLYFVIFISQFRFYQLQLYEVAMLAFYLIYSFTGAFSLYPASSIRIMAGALIYLACYMVMKSILAGVHQSVIDKSIGYVGLIFNASSLLLYVIGLKSVGYFFDTEGIRISEFGLMIDRNYPRLIGLLQDPNFFVFYNTVFFAYYLCNSKGWLNKAGLILCIVTNILTFSRGGLLVMVVLFLLYGMLNHPFKQLKMTMGVILSVAFACYIAVVYLKFDLISILESRMNDFTSDGGSGRIELWGRAWEYFETHKIVGIGAFNFADYNAFKYGDNLSVHNTFLDVLAEAGLLGIFFYLLFLSLVVYQLYQRKIYKHKPYLFLTVIGMVLQMGFLSVIINDIFFMVLAILSTYLNQRKRKAEEVKSQVTIVQKVS
ncbi:O-antigen ligase family protein [Halobacillus sp. HZG1]|uniref:O-antigen ligase family protein n=1 Tax=Halobacillus sp. HZG1 TaxID=3111769 RepID=UPI002DC02C1F|nr:O-antigen ligase family protein [Halobacillus sp. HZG1]MEC3883970.1 O-antigen ligase family protein [Halobacillus sp. HZG1]